MRRGRPTPSRDSACRPVRTDGRKSVLGVSMSVALVRLVPRAPWPLPSRLAGCDHERAQTSALSRLCSTRAGRGRPEARTPVGTARRLPTGARWARGRAACVGKPSREVVEEAGRFVPVAESVFDRGQARQRDGLPMPASAGRLSRIESGRDLARRCSVQAPQLTRSRAPRLIPASSRAADPSPC